MKNNTSALERHTFKTSRQLEFVSEKELALQTGHPSEQWACVIGKELGDNGIDAAEEDRVMPDVSFTVCTAKHKGSITVTDNASGIPADTVDSLLDFSVRVSSREAYVAPTRGAQGNALKTIIMMPHVLLAGGKGKAEPVVIEACGIRHSISISVDAVQQKPVAVHEQERSKKKNGTTITVPWPNVSLLAQTACAKSAILTNRPRLRDAQSACQLPRRLGRRVRCLQGHRSRFQQVDPTRSHGTALV
jgi:DNA topoisomerase VI subunit B